MSAQLPGAGRIPLSFNQEFMCALDEGDESGPFGPRYHMVYGWRIGGRIDLDVLQGALDDVVARHEALRTRVVRGEHPYQEINPPSSPTLTLRDLTGTHPADRDRVAEELLIEMEADGYGTTRMPLLHAVLGRFDEQDAVLALTAHHTAVDGWSMQLIGSELAECYAARRAGRDPDLPEVPQYQEFTRWERDSITTDALERSRAYWRETLAGAQITGVHTDFLRSENLPKNTSVERYLIDPDTSAAVLELARSTRSSPFMVLLAAYKMLIREITGAVDVTVCTIMSGRNQSRFEKTVGPFFNLVPLRTNLAGISSFQDLVKRVRRTCLSAFSHVIPFTTIMGDNPELGTPYVTDDTAVVAFQVFQFPFVMAEQRVGELSYSEIRRRLLPAADSTDIPDGALWTLDIDPAGNEMIGQLQYNSNRFHATSMRGLVSQYQQVLKTTVSPSD